MGLEFIVCVAVVFVLAGLVLWAAWGIQADPPVAPKQTEDTILPS